MSDRCVSACVYTCRGGEDLSGAGWGRACCLMGMPISTSSNLGNGLLRALHPLGGMTLKQGIPGCRASTPSTKLVNGWQNSCLVGLITRHCERRNSLSEIAIPVSVLAHANLLYGRLIPGCATLPYVYCYQYLMGVGRHLTERTARNSQSNGISKRSADKVSGCL